nr:hypothetical protein [Brevundimonas diminuta]
MSDGSPTCVSLKFFHTRRQSAQIALFSFRYRLVTHERDRGARQLEKCLDLESDASRSADARSEPTLYSETTDAVLLGERLNRSLEIVKLCRVLVILE